MSAHVRRLLTDVQPLWLAYAVVMAAIVLLTNTLWLMRPGDMMLMSAMFVVFVPATMFTAKAQTWRVLPVSRRDLARARWGAHLGIPLTALVLLAAVPLAVLRLIGHRGATLTEALALLGAQAAIATLIGFTFLSARATKRKFWPVAVVVILVLCLMVPFSGFLIKGAPTPREQVWLMGAGLVSLAVATLAYVFAERFSPTALAATVAAPVRARGDRRFQAKGPTGWPAIMPAIGRVVAIWGLALAVADLIFARILPQHGPSNFVLIMALMSSYIFAAFVPMSIRALRGLPMGPARLTLIVQGVLALGVSLGILILAAIFRLTDQDTTDLPPFLLIVLGVNSTRLPLDLRFGQTTALMVSLTPLIAAPFVLLLDTPSIMAGALAIMAGAWIWTWWELYRGRHAYKPRPIATARWRTAG